MRADSNSLELQPADERWNLVRTHIAKGDKAKDKAEQHYIAAGRYLAQLKADHTGTWAEWETLVKERAGIGKSRASELMQIADGRKTVDDVRADTAKRTAETKERLKLSATSGENAEDNASATTDAGTESRDTPPALEIHEPLVKEALQMVEQMSEDDRYSFFWVLQNHYPDDYGHPIYESDTDAIIVGTIIEAIGPDRAKALAKKMPRLVLAAVGKAALPDCKWCGGSGLMAVNLLETGEPAAKVPCECTSRKRGENDFAMLHARIERENQAQRIPEQDFSFGLEVTTKDGKVWASGVRLPTKEEAEFYIDYWARHELKMHGYVPWKDDPNTDVLAFDIKRYDEQPLMKIYGGKRKGMSFMHGTCHLLDWKGWHPIAGGECECKKCRGLRKRREADARERERFISENETVDAALASGEISQEQYDEWLASPVNKPPAWVAKLKARPQADVSASDDDPETSAAAMKAKLAALDAKAAI